MLKNLIWEGLGVNYAKFGRGLGRSEPSFRYFYSHFGCFGMFQIICFKALVQDELQEAFWMDFGSLWDGFGRVWGGIWKYLGPFRQVMGSEALLPSPKSNLHLQWYQTNF